MTFYVNLRFLIIKKTLLFEVSNLSDLGKDSKSSDQISFASQLLVALPKRSTYSGIPHFNQKTIGHSEIQKGTGPSFKINPIDKLTPPHAGAR